VPKLHGKENLIKRILVFLEYIETYYDKLMDISFCRGKETENLSV